MAYEKYTWITGDVITAEKMNRSEEELSEISREIESARGNYLDLSKHLEAMDEANSQITNDMSGVLDTLS